MGNILYRLLEGKANYVKTSSTKVASLVKRGKRPAVSQETKQSTDPMIQSLYEAMKMCFVHTPSNRPSSKEILEHLLKIQQVKNITIQS